MLWEQYLSVLFIDFVLELPPLKIKENKSRMYYLKVLTYKYYTKTKKEEFNVELLSMNCDLIFHQE